MNLPAADISSLFSYSSSCSTFNLKILLHKPAANLANLVEHLFKHNRITL